MSRDFPPSLGLRIRQARRLRSMTQADLAEQCGVSAEFVGRIERGRAVPSVHTLMRIATALDVSVDALLLDGHEAELAAVAEAPAAPGEETRDGPQLRRLRRHLQSASPRTLDMVVMVLDAIDGHDENA